MPTADARTSIHVYNARHALTVEPAQNRRGDTYTANLETASRSDGQASFRWEAKLVVQITRRELPDVLAVLLGHLPASEFLYHGPSRDKGYRLFHDRGRVIVQLFSGRGERHGVTLAAADRLAVSALLFRQLQRNHGELAADVLYAMIADVYRAAGPTSEPEGTTGAARSPLAERDRDGAVAGGSGVGSDPYDW